MNPPAIPEGIFRYNMYHESISLSILEKAGPYSQSVITGSGFELEDFVLVKPSLPTEEHVGGKLTNRFPRK